MKKITDFISVISSAQANLTINTALYHIEAIHAAIYAFTGRYHILVTPNADNSVTVIFEAKDTSRNIVDELKDFTSSLIDHQVRLQLDETNHKIRDLIVKHAFFPVDLEKEIKSLWNSGEFPGVELFWEKEINYFHLLGL
jgi:His-Xaa-Ser system protein HxsD